MLTAAAVLLLTGSIVLVQRGQTALGVQLGDLAITLAVLVLLFVLLQFTIGPWLVYRGTPAFRAPQTWEFTEDGVQVIANVGSSQLRWAAYRRARIDREFVFLQVRTGFQIFPRRVISDPTELARLDGLLNSHLRVSGHA
ncbi:MAG TPA: YcxB family protein [Candidatus Solibacter sp.]|nr:YcxB family protein [Candidatus Solibacter sp.]